MLRISRHFVESLGTINKQIDYPVLTILNPKNKILFQYSGFLTATELDKILTLQ